MSESQIEGHEAQLAAQSAGEIAPDVVEWSEPLAVQPDRATRVKKWFGRLFSTRLEKSDRRIRLVAVGFGLVYCVIAGKLVWLGFKPEPASLRAAAVEASTARKCRRRGFGG